MVDFAQTVCRFAALDPAHYLVPVDRFEFALIYMLDSVVKAASHHGGPSRVINAVARAKLNIFDVI